VNIKFILQKLIPEATLQIGQNPAIFPGAQAAANPAPVSLRY
jgi:hypothetical protein